MTKSFSKSCEVPTDTHRSPNDPKKTNQQISHLCLSHLEKFHQNQLNGSRVMASQRDKQTDKLGTLCKLVELVELQLRAHFVQSVRVSEMMYNKTISSVSPFRATLHH